MVFDLESGTVAATVEHDGEKLGKIPRIDAIDDDRFAWFAKGSVGVVSVSGDVLRSRKHKEGRGGTVVRAAGKAALAMATDAKDGLLVVGITSKSRLKLLEKTGLRLRDVAWHDGRLVGQDTQRVWRRIHGVEPLLHLGGGGGLIRQRLRAPLDGSDGDVPEPEVIRDRQAARGRLCCAVFRDLTNTGAVHRAV